MCKCCCSKWFSKIFGSKKSCCEKKAEETKQADLPGENSANELEVKEIIAEESK
ncbi:MAG: hypothetical protein PHW67_01985 [Bacilli bacterium]|nr:hypothetical protein [Bacilli bacterium]